MSEATVVVDEVQASPEKQEQEANDALTAGYNKAKGVTADATEKASDKAETEQKDTATTDAPAAADKAAQDADAKAKQEAEAKAEADSKKFLEDLPKRFRNLEGQIGGLKSQLTTALATAKAAATAGKEAPTQAQITAASVSSEKWKKLEDDFPEFAAAFAERQAASQEELKKLIPQIDVDGIKKDVGAAASAELRKEFLTYLSPDWEKLDDDPAFTAWLEANPDHKEKVLTGSPVAITNTIGAYKKHVEAESSRHKKQSRLATVIAPKQANAGGPSVLPDEAGLSVGYNRIAKQRA